MLAARISPTRKPCEANTHISPDVIAELLIYFRRVKSPRFELHAGGKVTPLAGN